LKAVQAEHIASTSRADPACFAGHDDLPARAFDPKQARADAGNAGIGDEMPTGWVTALYAGSQPSR
jgi:hypothetical protein